MQHQFHSIGRTARLAAFALLIISGQPGFAQSTTPETTDVDVLIEEPIDASKNGTVEAEIAADAESTTAPPSRTLLKSRLMDKRWDRGGYFLGLGAHYQIETNDRIKGYAQNGGASVRVGIKHDRFWQTEFSALYYSKFKDDVNNYWGWGVHLGERFYFTKTRLQPYVGVHLGLIQTRGTFHGGGRIGFTPKFNVGLNLYQRPTFNWELDLAYFYGTGATKDYDFVTATLGFTWF